MTCSHACPFDTQSHRVRTSFRRPASATVCVRACATDSERSIRRAAQQHIGHGVVCESVDARALARVDALDQLHAGQTEDQDLPALGRARNQRVARAAVRHRSSAAFLLEALERAQQAILRRKKNAPQTHVPTNKTMEGQTNKKDVSP